MTAALLGALTALVAAMVGLRAWELWLRRPARQRKRSIRIHAAGGEEQRAVVTLEGVLLAVRGGYYLLAEAKVIESEESTVELAGNTSIPRERVLFFQELGP